MKSVLCVLVLLFSFAKTQQKYVIPDVTITALKPKGLIVTLPDSPGVQLFGFHANVNNPLKGKEDGSIAQESVEAENGIWKIVDKNVMLKVGDVLNYWVFVQRNRLGFDRLDQKFTISVLTTEGSIPTPCNPTSTKINGGQTVCGGTLLFEDNFSNNNIDEAKWIREQYIPSLPDYEFNTYEKQPEVLYINNGVLHFKLIPRNEPFVGHLDLSNGCTGKNCTAVSSGTIIAPMISGKIKSRFSFLYGKIEIRAQLPRGDWLYPQLYLEPKDYQYGDDYNSGRMWLAYARGNLDLVSQNSQIGNKILYGGVVLSAEEPARTHSAIKVGSAEPWGAQYHTYTLTWRPDGVTFNVDGVNGGNSGSTFSQSGAPNAHAWSSPMAPFDKEFVLSLGLGVGGLSDFPDFSTSNGQKQPWKKLNNKATLLFHRAMSTWFPTWHGEDAELKIEHVKIWSL